MNVLIVMQIFTYWNKLPLALSSSFAKNKLGMPSLTFTSFLEGLICPLLFVFLSLSKYLLVVVASTYTTLLPKKKSI
jgi:hypothetical protein